jgi:ATP-dependent protease ClpP protease subunit
MPRNYLKARKALEETVPTRPKIAIVNEDGGLRVNIYDEIGPWGVNASDFVREFSALDPGSKAVHVHINSPGGDVYDGLAIYQTLKASPAKVTVHVDGLAASAASFIAMAGDEVIMGRNARMMIHDASTMIYGNAQDLRETAEWLDEESDNIADIYAQRAGGKATDWRGTMRAEKWYSANEAVAAGLADAIDGADAKMASVATSVFRTPDGPAQPVNQESDLDFDSIALALKGAFT